MQLNHLGIVNKSEEDAVRFYRDFLGFEQTKESVVPAELSKQIFNVSRDIRMVVFQRKEIKIEVFIDPEYAAPPQGINHIGFLLDNFSEIADRARRSGIELITGKTKDKTVYFIRDFSGNLIEIKQT